MSYVTANCAQGTENYLETEKNKPLLTAKLDNITILYSFAYKKDVNILWYFRPTSGLLLVL